jgi:hypothetical protein
MKSGTTELEVSDNGRYIGIINKKDPSKKEALQDNVVMLDGTTLATLWQKEVMLDEKNYDRAFAVTNSGKAVLLRAAKGMKLSNYLIVVSKDNQEDKQFEEAVMLQNPKAISIGQADYLVDFNYSAKGLRSGDYEKIMLYDIANGKTIKNNTISEFNSLKDISSINITNVILQSNEIHLFTEAKVKAGTRPVKTNPFSSMSFDEPYYKFGPANLIIMSFEGEVKEIKKLNTDYNALADFYHSFGLLNVNGKYYINTGSNNMVYEQPIEKNAKTEIATGISDDKDPYRNESPKYVAQLFAYVRDAKKFILCRVHADNKMSLVSFTGFPKEK